MSEKEHRQRLAAPCGLYCGACSIYAAVKRGDAQLLNLAAGGLTQKLGHPVEASQLDCDGCLSDTVAIQCRECVLRDCALSKSLTRCLECNDFPCQPLIDFSNDGLAHHTEVLDNVRRQREIGIDAWIAEQAGRWFCPVCDQASDWYAAQCHNCGTALEDHF